MQTKVFINKHSQLNDAVLSGEYYKESTQVHY